MEEDKKEIRCIHCNKLLGIVPNNVQVEIEIKCPRCKMVHIYKTAIENERCCEK